MSGASAASPPVATLSMELHEPFVPAGHYICRMSSVQGRNELTAAQTQAQWRQDDAPGKYHLFAALASSPSPLATPSALPRCGVQEEELFVMNQVLPFIYCSLAGRWLMACALDGGVVGEWPSEVYIDDGRARLTGHVLPLPTLHKDHHRQQDRQ